MKVAIIAYHLPTEQTWQSAWEVTTEPYLQSVRNLISQLCAGGKPFEMNLEGGGFLHFPIEVVQQCVFKLITKEEP